MVRLGGIMKETQRLDKILSNMGFGSRKEIKIILKKGYVHVDGQVIKDSSIHVNPESQEIKVNGQKIIYKKHVYLMLNKPQGVVSATEDNREKTVIDLLADQWIPFNPFPVGRLDKDTEGLLILTNDGKLAHELLSPRKHIPKTYLAELDGEVGTADIEAVAQGILLDDGYFTLPGHLEIMKSVDGFSTIKITITEGKYHQVKRMFAALGKKVVFLKRISMGKLQLDETLKLGEHRELTEEEVDILKLRIEV